jgi:thiol:disulfide interchange protein DsbD
MRLIHPGRLAAHFVVLLCLWMTLSCSAFAQNDTGSLLPVTEAYKLTTDASTPGVLKLHWTIAPDYYLYRGRMKFKAGDGVTLSEAQLPDGAKHHDEYLGDVETYHHSIDATLPYTVAAGTARLKLSVQYQGCHEVDPKICYPPYTAQLDLPLTPGAASTIATAGTTTPSHANGSLSAALRAIGSPPPTGAGATTLPSGNAADPAPEAPPAGVAQDPLNLFAALLLALGGGLVLNLMPCVLPVLSIKAVSVLESGESASRARRHALYYTAGVLSSFAVLGLGILALRSAGHALGWGTQLQQPIVVGVLAMIMLAVGLSMSGVVQFGASLGNTGATLASRSGPAGDFFTGVLAVVVASPCTAPFMGSALAYAFAAPMLSALLVFLMLGVGLALPFLLIGFVPALARLLPRPGRWMETLKQVLAFPMYLTAVWLVWVLAHQRGADAVGLVLVAMVLLAMTLWWFERSRSRGTISRVLVAVLALATLVPVYLLAHVPPVSSVAVAEDGVVAYSPEKLAALRAAGTPVFVDMTADWCVTCKANEHTVLDTQAFRDLLQHTGAVYMKGDWTDVNPTISAFLQQYHSPGVPLYVVFPKHNGAGQQLSTVLTSALVEQALTAAAQQ